MIIDKAFVETILTKNNVKLPDAEVEKFVPILKAVFLDGKMVKDAVGFSDSLVEQFYNAGVSHYRLGQYAKANELFRFTYLLNPNISKYIQALAASYHKMKAYPLAIKSYFLWGVQETSDPLPFYYLFDCYEKMGMTIDERLCILEAIARCGKNPDYKILKGKLEMILEGLDSKAAELAASEKTHLEASGKGAKKR